MSEFETLGKFKPTFNFETIGTSTEGTITDYKVINTKFSKNIGVITIGEYSVYETAGLKIYELNKHIGRYVRITYTDDKHSNKYFKKFKVFKVELKKIEGVKQTPFKNLEKEGFNL